MIENKKPAVTFKGDGSTTVFPFSFALVEAKDMHVSIYDTTTGTATELPRDYFVDMAGKTVHYPGYAPGQEPAAHDRPPALPATKTITLYRKTVIDQRTDLGEKYPLPYIETMVDKTTAILQEFEEQIERSVKVTLGDSKKSADLIQSLYERAAAAEKAAAAAKESENTAGTAANSALGSKEVAEGLAAQMYSVINDAMSVAETKLRNRLAIEFLLKSVFNGHLTDASAHAPAFAVHNKDENAHPNLGLYLRRNSTAYAVGDIAYCRALPSWARLECVKAGTTTDAEPAFASITKAGQLIKDGTVTWLVDDVRDGARVGDIILRPTLRDGYIKANGATVKRADYPRLVAYVEEAGLWTDDVSAYPGLYGKGDGSTTMTVPDYRGHFLRALDEGRGIDPVRALGSTQKGSLMIADDNTDIVSLSFDGSPNIHDVFGYDPMSKEDYPKRHHTRSEIHERMDMYLENPAYWGVTRPRNIALIAQIKY